MFFPQVLRGTNYPWAGDEQLVFVLENKAARDWKESFSAQGLKAPKQLIYSLCCKLGAMVAAVISA